MTLKKGILWSQKKMRPQSVKRNGKYQGVMGKIMGNEKIAKVLDQPRERKEFFGILKSAAKGGVYKQDLRKIFGGLRSGQIRSKHISQKELRVIAKEFFPDSAKRYSFKSTVPPKNTLAYQQNNRQTYQRNSDLFKEIKGDLSSLKSAPAESGAFQRPITFKRRGNINAPDTPPKITTLPKSEKKYVPGSSLDFDFAKPGFVKKADLAKAVAPSNISPSDKNKDQPVPEKKKNKSAKKYVPGSSLDFDFAKPGFGGKTGSDSSGSSIEKTKTEILVVPEKKDTKSAKHLPSIDDMWKYDFAKPGFGGKTGTATTPPPSDDKQMTPMKMAAIMNRVRANSEEFSGDGQNKKPKSSFSGAMAATMKKKRS